MSAENENARRQPGASATRSPASYVRRVNRGSRPERAAFIRHADKFGSDSSTRRRSASLRATIPSPASRSVGEASAA